MQNSLKLSLKPILAALILALSFACMGVFIRMMVGSFETWQQVYLRILLAGLMAQWVFRRHVTVQFWRSLTARDWGFYGLRAIFAYVIGVGFFTIAITNAQLGTVAFVSSLPIMGVLGWLFFRERVRLATLPFIALSVAGLLLLTGAATNGLRLGWGETAALISLLGFDIGFLMSRLHPKKFSNFQNTTVLLLVGWVPLFVVSVLMDEPLLSPHVSMIGWVGLVVSAVLNVTGLYLVNYVFGHLKAYVAGNILLLEGVFAALLGLLLYGEVPSALAAVGAVIILICGYLVSYFDARKPSVVAKEGA